MSKARDNMRASDTNKSNPLYFLSGSFMTVYVFIYFLSIHFCIKTLTTAIEVAILLKH